MTSRDDASEVGGADTDAGELRRLRAMVANLEELLEVHEQIVAQFDHSKEIRRRLARSEANFKMLVERLPDAILVFQGAVVRYVNPALARLLGYADPERLCGPSPAAVLLDATALARLGARAAGSEDPAGAPLHLRWSTADGAVVVVEAESAAIRYDEQAAVLVIARDVTDKLRRDAEREASEAEVRRMQAQLVLADRMASVGTLAAGVAHEINNPLAYVMANLELIAEAAEALPAGPNTHALREMIGHASMGAERVHKIVGGLKPLSRADEERRVVLDARAVLDVAVAMAFNEIRHRASLVHDYRPLPPVEADEARLTQVFINLLVNAAQALPEGESDKHRITIVTRTDIDGNAVIEVADTGAGMAPQVRARIFDPFFTTKPVGVGSGLGLSICHSIVTALGGQIIVDSEPGRGSAFRVVLPPARRAIEVPVKRAPTPRPATDRRGRILVIDDDDMVGDAIKMVLEDHDVTLTTAGARALAWIVAGEVFDLILCDLMMPRMSGMELHHELSQRAPDQAARMVFVTGGAFTPAARAFLDRVPNERLGKPFDITALRELVQRRL